MAPATKLKESFEGCGMLRPGPAMGRPRCCSPRYPGAGIFIWEMVIPEELYADWGGLNGEGAILLPMLFTFIALLPVG